MRKTKIHASIPKWRVKLFERDPDRGESPLPDDLLNLAKHPDSKEAVKLLRFNRIDPKKVRDILVEYYDYKIALMDCLLVQGLRFVDGNSPAAKQYNQALAALETLKGQGLVGADLELVEKDISRLKAHSEKMAAMKESEIRERTAKEMLGRQAYRLLEYFEALSYGSKKIYHSLIADILSGVYESSFTAQDIKWMTDDIFQREKE